MLTDATFIESSSSGTLIRGLKAALQGSGELRIARLNLFYIKVTQLLSHNYVLGSMRNCFCHAATAVFYAELGSVCSWQATRIVVTLNGNVGHFTV